MQTELDRRQLLGGAVGLGVAAALCGPSAGLADGGKRRARYRWDLVKLGLPGADAQELPPCQPLRCGSRVDRMNEANATKQAQRRVMQRRSSDCPRSLRLTAPHSLGDPGQSAPARRAARITHGVNRMSPGGGQEIAHRMATTSAAPLPQFVGMRVSEVPVGPLGPERASTGAFDKAAAH
jgi:hypothetical protein